VSLERALVLFIPQMLTRRQEKFGDLSVL